RVLTIFSVFFMPLTFIVGVYGMNFEWFPELKWKWGYPGVMVLMAGVSTLIFLYFKRRKWL
ncbi:MAG: magnesium transporter CorA, partial [Spirochaetia bacterium]|nr:magnesium transporter CorA [Spirochaetia bacterium]